jgi:hypothetical protein
MKRVLSAVLAVSVAVLALPAYAGWIDVLRYFINPWIKNG